MSLSLAIRAAARRDIGHHADFIGRRNRPAGRRFLDAAQAAVRKLAETPELGGLYEHENPRLAGLRVWPIRRFKNHLIYYIPTETQLIVVRLLHGAQDIDSILADEE